MFFPCGLKMVNNLAIVPMHALLNAARLAANCQLGHHHHRLRRGGEHIINNLFTTRFRQLG